jgi:6-pyruvoyltetrahydropterin/6-carboxytetrahydropterin synthase
MYELTKWFAFDAAHTLERTINADGSRRIHGHSYRAEVTLRGLPDPISGMLMDTSRLEAVLAGAREALDHRFLDEVEGLGPGTLENLAAFVWRRLDGAAPGLHSVTVFRDSTGDRVRYFGAARP